MMDLDDLTDLIINHRCICNGARLLLLNGGAVPCPDCGDDS